MAGNHNFEMYKQLLLPLYHQVHTTLNNSAVPAAPVATENVQLDIDLAQITRARLFQQRGAIQSKLEAIINTTQEWQNAIQQLARAARNVSDEEFNVFCANNNTAATRNDADARIDAINDRLGDVDIFIVTRRHALPAPAAAPLPAAGAPVPDDLSKLEVPKFSGDKQSDWFEWLGQFNSVIGENGRLTDLRKFAHLKSLMEGEAAKVIKGITLSAANYQIAFDALKVQYGNKELYKLNLLDKLDHLPLCRNFYDVMAFRLEVDSICRLITNADPANHDMEAKTVATRLEAKLTLPLMREVAIERARVTAAHLANPIAVADWTTTQFRTILGSLVDREKLMYGMRNGDSTSKRPPNDGVKAQKPKAITYDSKRQTVHALTEGTPSSSAEDQRTQNVASVSAPSPPFRGGGRKQKGNNRARSRSKSRTPQKSQSLYCKLCESKEHYPSACPRYHTIKMRRSRTDELRLCHRCFRPGHKPEACDRPSKCSNCKGDHHIVFCPNQKVLSAAVITSRSGENDDDFNVDGHSTNSASVIYGQQPTTRFFLGAEATVFNVDFPNRSSIRKPVHPTSSESGQKVVLLFDTGAQRSFIHKSLASQLSLRADFKESINLGVFGQLSTTPMKVSVSKIGVRLPSGGNIVVEATHIEQLMSDIAIYPVQSEDDPTLSTPVLRGDPTSSVPHVIIGIDYFWHFQPKVIRILPSGFILLKLWSRSSANL